MGSFGILVLEAVERGLGATHRALLFGGDGHGDTFRFER
jgi:hypothetical protein